MEFQPKVFLDTNVLISSFLKKDINYFKARAVLDVIKEFNGLIYLSPLVLLEICVTLHNSGENEGKVSFFCDNVINSPIVRIINLDSSQIVPVVNGLFRNGIDLKSNDLFISSIPITFQTYFVTFDQKIYSNVSPFYKFISNDAEGLRKLLMEE